MATSNLEALNELIQKIKAGERRAKSNLEALNLLCVIAGGTGAARSNLEALNELLTVFSPGGETQEKAVTITANGTTEITPDEGYTLSKATVNVNVPSGSSEYNAAIPSIDNTPGSAYIYRNISKINLDGVRTVRSNYISYMFEYCSALRELIFGDFFGSFAPGTLMYCENMFFSCTALESIDLSGLRGLKLANVVSMFYGCGLRSIDLSGVEITATSINNMFRECTNLEYVDLSGSTLSEVTTATSSFSNCTSLTNLVLADGCFRSNNLTTIDFSYSPLSHDCAVDIFNKLAKRTNTPKIKLSATTKGYLTDAEKAIATDKGWVIA